MAYLQYPVLGSHLIHTLTLGSRRCSFADEETDAQYDDCVVNRLKTPPSKYLVLESVQI